MPRVEREQGRPHGVPAVLAPRDDQVAVELLAPGAVDHLVEQVGLVRVRDRVGRPRDVDHAEQAGEREREEILGECDEAVRDDRIARFGEHLQPEGEALGVELGVGARSAGAPEILVEDVAELLEAREGDQLAGVLEADLEEQLAQCGGRQRLQARREVGRFEQLREEPGAHGAVAKGVGHRFASSGSGWERSEAQRAPRGQG